MGNILSWLSRAKARVRASRAQADLQVVVDSYYMARPFYPAKPVCRLDAMALCLFLRRYGIQADYVLGVRLDPFIAHSWVQIHDVVVGEAHDRMRQYTPMLVI